MHLVILPGAPVHVFFVAGFGSLDLEDGQPEVVKLGLQLGLLRLGQSERFSVVVEVLGRLEPEALLCFPGRFRELLELFDQLRVVGLEDVSPDSVALPFLPGPGVGCSEGPGHGTVAPRDPVADVSAVLGPVLWVSIREQDHLLNKSCLKAWKTDSFSQLRQNKLVKLFNQLLDADLVLLGVKFERHLSVRIIDA